jgi:ABC-2 type transport system permease protein
MAAGQARTVAWITLRATLGRKRAVLFAVPPLILVLVTALLTQIHPLRPGWPGTVLGQFGFAVVLPLTALIVGTSVLGAEIDDGSVVHLLATPVRRTTVILAKFAVAVALTVLFAALPEFLAGVIATGGGTRLADGLFLGALAGSVMYNAVFLMLSAATSRAIAVGLLYLLIWESLLSPLVSGVQLLSVAQYSLGMANAVARDPALHAHLAVSPAAALGAVVTVAALTVAVRRLARFSLRGDVV